MKKKTYGILLAAVIAAFYTTGCGGSKTETPSEVPEEYTEESVTESTGEAGEKKDSVIVVMGPTSEPESGFDPTYGWGAGEHVHEPLIQSTLTVTTTDLSID